MKAILAAAALAIAASAVPAAAYDGDHRQYKPSTTYGTTKTYNQNDKYDNDRRDTRTTRVDRDDRYERRDHDSGRRFWQRRHHRDDSYVEYRPHRRHWWSYWD